MSNRIALAIAALALVIGGVAFFQSGGRTFGGQLYELDKVQFVKGLYAGASKQFELTGDGALTLGASGTSQSLFIETTCNLSQSSPGSHAATTSKEYFCTVTGVQAGDTIEVILPAGAGAYSSGASSNYGGFAVGSAYATTSDRIGVTLVNNTGAATSSAAQATTSAKVLVYR